MKEERLSIKIETEERFRPAETAYLKKRGVKKLGDRDVFIIEETERGIQICGGDATRYYFDDKPPEELPSTRACILFPIEFLPELKQILDKYLFKEAQKTMGK